MSDYLNKFYNLADLVGKRRNVLLHAPGGVGKTYALTKLVESLNPGCGCRPVVVGVTALTGGAALRINDMNPTAMARTIHSWAGVELARGSLNDVLRTVKGKGKAIRRWVTTDLLIIDEVSMMSKDLMDKLDFVAKQIRHCSEPFGGMVVVVSGDFLQLPPVEGGWVFDSEAWKSLKFVCVSFDEPQRYPDIAYFNMLKRIRVGEPTDDDIDLLWSRVAAYTSYKEEESSDTPEKSVGKIKPTILYSRRVDVMGYNMGELEKLPDTTRIFTAVDGLTTEGYVRPDIRERLKKKYQGMFDNDMPSTIPLKIGAQVMLKVNLDVDNGLVNGSRGVVLQIGIDNVMVKFRIGIVAVALHTWKIEEDDVVATRRQIPLTLAWAATIHSCQGSSLDYACIDIGPSIFSPGQAYVALSRVRTFEGLLISSFTPKSIHASAEALKFINSLENASEDPVFYLLSRGKCTLSGSAETTSMFHTTRSAPVLSLT